MFIGIAHGNNSLHFRKTMISTNIRKRFFDELKRGTEEGILILKVKPTIDFSDLIIKGAVTNYSYDNQAEGSSANYIYRFIQKLKQKDKIVNLTVLK